MKILLVSPQTPDTFWSFKHVLRFVSKRASFPPLGLLTGGVDFKELAWVLRPAQGTNPAIIMKYGSFLQSVFDFFLVALAIFAMVQVITKLKHKQAVAAAPAEPTKQEVLLEQIRDAVRAQRGS